MTITKLIGRFIVDGFLDVISLSKASKSVCSTDYLSIPVVTSVNPYSGTEEE